MNLVTIKHLTKSYTERLLFDDTSFNMGEGDKIGLVDINGAGKPTLLKIVAGLEELGKGAIVRSRDLDIRYLSQSPKFRDGDTIVENIVRDNESHDHPWDLRSQVKTVLMKVDTFSFGAKVEILPGGQHKHVALVSTLMSNTDLLVLDEPTNHLDSDMAGWLGDYLKKFRGTLPMITYDRYFLDSVTNWIVELGKGKLYSYQGGYEAYLRLKIGRVGMELISERKRQSVLRVELEQIQRGARTRSTKQKNHIQRYEALQDQKAPEFDQGVELGSVPSRSGRTTVEVEKLYKIYGDKVLPRDFTYIFLKNDRIGIIESNDGRKSMLMRMITGWVEPDPGNTEMGQTVKMRYFSQENEAMGESLEVIDYIKNVTKYVQTKDGSVSASQMLERFLFPGSVQYTTIDRLSGGEKRRPCLLRVLMDIPNALLLDESTSGLDIRTLTILEDYLDSFQGTVITVPHDRYFLDRCTRGIFAFEGDGKVERYEGGFTGYQATYALRHPEEDAGSSRKTVNPVSGVFGISGAPEANGTSRKKSSTGTRGGEQKLRFTYQEQKDQDVIRDEIVGLEEEVANLKSAIEASAHDFVKLNQLMEEKTAKEETLEEKMERWMYLNRLAEKITNQ